MHKALWIICASLVAFHGSISAQDDTPYLEPIIAEEAIAQRVAEVGKVLNQQYAGKELTIVSILKGSMCITADLMRELDCPLSVEFIRCSSYGQRGSARGELTVKGLDDLNLENQDVLLVDDIFDSGTTLTFVIDKIKEKNPKSLQTLVLLAKKTARTTTYRPDYVLFDIENYFVVGYGLDYKEYFRELPGVYNLRLEHLPKNLYLRAHAIHQ